MDYIVLKRDGETEVFDKDKVFNAIRSAFEDIDGSLSNYGEEKCKSISDYIESEVINRANDETGILSVEEIQDLIENKLCSSKRKDVASSYIRYRYKKEVARNFQKDFIDEIRKKLNAGDVQNQNANVDEYSFGGRIGEASDVVTKKLAKDYIISDMAKYNHENNIIYIHDFGSYYVGSHNCLSIPFDDLLRKGFNTRQTDVRPANSINTAFQLLAVIFQLQSLQQFGGVSATHLDWTMVPYLRKSFFKHYLIAYLKSTEEFLKLDIQDLLFDVYEEKVGDTLTVTRNGFEDWIESHKKEFLFKMGLTEKDFYLDNNDLDPVLKQSALYDTIIELKQAVEGMYHNLNTLQSRSGNQLPFTSINYGTCTSTEGRLITRELLQGSINGVGKLHKTSIFPCGIFQYMKGVNNKPGTPNYDLYRLALESTSKRLYPNYANVDWSGNEGYDVNDPRTYFSTMGCLDYNEKITIRSHRESRKHSETVVKIGDLFEHIRNNKSCSYKDNKLQHRAKSIKDEVDREKFIKNGYLLYSGDHFNQWATNFKEIYKRKPTKSDFKDLTGVPWDRSRIMTNRGADMSLVSKWDSYLELKVCDILNLNGYTQKFTNEECLLDTHYIRNKFFTCSDGSRKQCDIYFPTLRLGIEVNDFFTHSKDSDSEVYTTNSGINCHKDDYQGYKKGPTYSKNKISALNKLGIEVIELWEDEIRDRTFISKLEKLLNKSLKDEFDSGIINDNYETVLPRTTYIDLENNHVSRFVKDIDGTFVKIKKILRNSDVSNWMEITTSQRSIKVTTDHPFIIETGQIVAGELSVGDYLLNEDGDREFIIKIDYYNDVDYSYDIETESESFVFSGIQSHNCRTANGADINAEPGQNPYIKDGRGNICPVTIIMPTLAMIVKTRLEKDGTYSEEKLIDEFLSLLDVKINEAKDMLIERFNWIASQSSKAASFMYENGLMLGYKPEEGIVSALKHGTLAVGQLGLAETLQILIKCDQTTEKGMELAKRIEQLFKTRCAEFKEEYRLNFGVYYTPAENLCYTAMKKFRDRFGVIPKVSDKDYFTNSIHVPVYDKLSVFDKIDTEAQLTGYSSAGCITYVELDGTVQKNIDALEEIVNYAMEKDIPYFAVNVPNDTCLNCGYTGEFNDKCPACGSTEIQQLRRVTGYLTGDYKSAFNKGKQQETENRVKHVNYME